MDNRSTPTQAQLPLIAQLETSLLRVWPSIDVEMIDGWAVRAAMGFSGRANSASAQSPHASLNEKRLHRIAAFFAARSLPTTIRTTPLCALDTSSMLKAAGFTSRGLAHTMTAQLPSNHLTIDPHVKLEATPTHDWLSGNTSLQKETSKQNPNALKAIATRIQVPVRFATIQSENQDLGFGLVAIDNGWAEMSSIIINPTHIGKGLGRALVTSLLSWAVQNGAASAFLQVDVTNSIALNLYRSLGFTVLYDYDTLRRDLP
jgi:N-acetylglutamate synthase